MQTFFSVRRGFGGTLSSLFLGALGAGGFGCASVSQVLVAPEVQSPVITPQGRVELALSNSGGREVDLFDDASARPPVYSSNFLAEDSDGAAVYAGLGFAPWNGVAISGGLLGATSVIEGAWTGAKVQLLGREALLASSPVLVSTYGRIGTQWGSKEGDRDGDFGPHGFPWEATRSGSFLHLGASVGFEVVSWLVVYGGAGMGWANASAKVDQKVGTGGSPAMRYRNEFSADTRSWGGGLQIVGSGARLALSATRARVESGGQDVLDETQLGVSLEFKIHEPEASAP